MYVKIVVDDELLMIIIDEVMEFSYLGILVTSYG